MTAAARSALAQAVAQRSAALETSQWWPPAQIQAYQHSQLVHVAQHFVQHAPHFGRRLTAASLSPADLGLAAGLAALPLLERRDLQAAPDFFASHVPQGHLPLSVTSTSGSTGEPVVVRRTAVNHIDWLALTLRDHLWHAAQFAAPFAAIRANISAPTRLGNWGPPVSLLHASGPSLGLPITMDAAALFDQLAAFQPGTLLIYPNTMDALTAHAIDRGVTLPGLQRIRTVGETLTPRVRQAAAAHFQAAVTDAYSSQEVGVIALQCPVSGDYHVMAETLFVEVLNDQGQACTAGETGRVVITDLCNFASPLVRYAIGDYAEVGGPCPCGRGLPTLKRILGRQRNLIRMPDGRRHWPLVGFDRFRELAPIWQYQMVQEAPDEIEVRLCVERPLTSAEDAALRAHIQQALGHPFQLRLIQSRERLPSGPSGKFEEFICLI